MHYLRFSPPEDLLGSNSGWQVQLGRPSGYKTRSQTKDGRSAGAKSRVRRPCKVFFFFGSWKTDKNAQFLPFFPLNLLGLYVHLEIARDPESNSYVMIIWLTPAEPPATTHSCNHAFAVQKFQWSRCSHRASGWKFDIDFGVQLFEQECWLFRWFSVNAKIADILKLDLVWFLE